MCRFLDRESAKRTKLDDSGEFSVDLFQAIESADLGRGSGFRPSLPRPLLRRLTHSARRRPVCLRSDAWRDRPGSGASPAPTRQRNALGSANRRDAGRPAAYTPREPGPLAARCGQTVRAEDGVPQRDGVPHRRAAAAGRAQSGRLDSNRRAAPSHREARALETLQSVGSGAPA